MKTLLTSFTALLLFASQSFSHCQIPCGIFGDDDRFTAMLEDVTTIRKSVTQINELSKSDAPNYNQLVRWVSNKEDHADKISDTVLKYFLQQRIKPDQDHYEDKLVALHKIIVGAMKVKQTSDLEQVDALEATIKAFHELYTHKH